ncbi:uncharacterized protein LOC125518685 [Triticum urartu]|uniref:uncharacterized protein LOC125518685 n=1 Tax=Triticum urartu TaxID=4572 RepID=UPI0020448CA5|nr:uncharacterized protein LOC125518685 [Triticum urartu]
MLLLVLYLQGRAPVQLRHPRPQIPSTHPTLSSSSSRSWIRLLLYATLETRTCLKQNLRLLSQRRRPDGAESLSTPVGGPVTRPDHCKLLHSCQQPNQVEVVVLAPLFCFVLMWYKSASSADEDLSVAVLMRMQDPPPPASPSALLFSFFGS